MQEGHALQHHVQHLRAGGLVPTQPLLGGELVKRGHVGRGAGPTEVLLLEPLRLVWVEAGAAFDHAVQGELLGGLLSREKFAFVAGVPPQHEEHVHEGFWYVPLLPVPRPGVAALGVGPMGGEHREPACVAIPLAELAVAVGFEDQRQVREHRVIPSKRAVQQHVQRGTWQPFFPADDVRNAHVMVVDHVGQVVRGKAVRLHQNLVVEDGCLEAHFPTDLVFKHHRFVRLRRLEPHHEGRSFCLELGHFVGAQGQTVAKPPTRRGVVLPNVGLGRFAQGGQLLRRVERLVGQPLVQQALDGVLVQGGALALTVRAAIASRPDAFIWRQATPREGFFDVGFGALHKTTLVGVFDAKDESAAIGAGKQPIVEGRPDTAHVQGAGGTGGKANAYVIHGLQR